MSRTTDPLTLWRSITQAGGVDAYVQAQLVERGFLVQRRETDDMPARELEQYKKQLKAEAEEKRRLRREAWRAYRANHIVHLGENVFWTDEPPRGDGAAPKLGAAAKSPRDKYDLPDAEERAAENELPPLDTPQQLAKALGLTISQLRWLCYHREAATRVHYRRFVIAKRDGSPRPIWAPLPMLKAAQRWVLQHIVARLPVHGAAHGFLEGRSTITNAERHENARVVLKMDVKGFFPTVTLPRVKGVFRKAGCREQIATLLALLCTEAPREIVEDNGTTYYVALGPRCLPQGAPTSPALTNALCLRLDRRLSGLAKKLGWRYSRYADDMTFSLPTDHKGPPKLGALMGLARRVVEAEGFAIQPDKTRVHRRGDRQTVTGLVVNGDRGPRVPRTLRRQLRAAAHNLSAGKPLKVGESLTRLAGLAAYVYATDAKLGAELLSAFRQAGEGDHRGA